MHEFNDIHYEAINFYFLAAVTDFNWDDDMLQRQRWQLHKEVSTLPRTLLVRTSICFMDKASMGYASFRKRGG